MAISIETDFLIIGSGPAGASLACFLARDGHKGIMINSSPSTSDTPRAHITNMAALECLRDIGLYDECFQQGNAGASIQNYRWCETMAGEEYARNYAWGNGDRAGDYETASPCTHLDLPQSLLEPILLKYATTHGFTARFDTEFKTLDSLDDGGKVVCTLFDRIARSNITVRTKYLFGADGGRSPVALALGLPMTQIPGGGLAFNVLVRADLSQLMTFRQGNLHWCVRLEKDYPFMSVARMVKPWNEWMFVFFGKGPDAPMEERSFEEWATIISDVIGDEKVDVTVLGVNKWAINETSADVISKGNVFCLGDAIHRHPPTLGLGSNTAIQDAFNLSWKISHVHRTPAASPTLLQTYNTERQPIASQLVTLSNATLRSHIAVWEALGCAPYGTPLTQRLQGITQLRSNTPEGRQRRTLLKQRVDHMHHETHALGLEFAHLYTSPAVYAADEPHPFSPSGREAQDNQLYYEPCTYPGRRLPHAWLGTRIPGPLISTLDLAGKGRFTLFTGIGGEAWVRAAETVEEELGGVRIEVVRVRRGLEWEDVYLKWEDVRGVEEGGCVVVRPDFVVAWRARSAEGGQQGERLGRAMRSVLGV